METKKPVIYNYSKTALERYFLAHDSKPFRATQLFEALYRQDIRSFSEMTNFKKEFRLQIEEDFRFSELETVKIQISSDETKKFLFRLEDGNLIETVLMSHNYGYSVCVTTQVGCNMGCLFCASGQVKKRRNLETWEIVLQVLTIDRLLRKEEKRVSHVVIMGIGEPFDNYDNVVEFLRIINDNKGLEIGSRHITISTCGIVPKIYEFAELNLQVNLAISLHFANNEKRTRYMKINKKYPISKLMEALQYYYRKTNRKVTFEYILLDGINDSIADAEELVALIKGMNAYVNLIPYNETGVFKRTDKAKANRFFDFLMKNGINAVMRKEQGHDIDAACGQLRIKEMQWEEDASSKQ